MSTTRLNIFGFSHSGDRGNGGRSIFNRQNLLIGLLFLLLILMTVIQGQEEPEIPYDPDSAGPLGLRGLLLWLDELGYEVDQTGIDFFPLDAFGGSAGANRVDLLFVYPNTVPYTEVEAAAVHRWVVAGGTLVLIGPSAVDQLLEETFGVYMAEQAISFDAEVDGQPLLPDRQEDDRRFRSGDHLVLDNAPAAVPVLTMQNEPDAESTDVMPTLTPTLAATLAPTIVRTATVAVQQIGDGTVWHLASIHDFTNISLRDEREAGLLPPLLRTVPAGGRVLLDTYHLFASPTAEGEITSVQAWFYQTAAGRAIIFALLTIFGYLLLQGRRLGPPLPSTEGVRRREAAEFVGAMAGLQQRSRQHLAVAQYHKRRLRTALGQRYTIPSTLSDQEFLERIEHEKPGPPQEQLTAIRRLLEALSAEPNEATLIQAVGQIDEIIER